MLSTDIFLYQDTIFHALPGIDWMEKQVNGYRILGH
jgi:hypothetical protein